MRVFNLGVIVVALIVLTILIVWLSTAWMAFEKSLAHTFWDIYSCPAAERKYDLSQAERQRNWHASAWGRGYAPSPLPVANFNLSTFVSSLELGKDCAWVTRSVMIVFTFA
jgi:hypothetical protein